MVKATEDLILGKSTGADDDLASCRAAYVAMLFLTTKELQIVELLARGFQLKKIAKALEISAMNVRVSINLINQKKLKVKDKTAAVARWHSAQNYQPFTNSHYSLDNLPNGILPQLTAEYRKFLVLMARGLSHEEIATTMKITNGAARGQASKIFKKLGVGKRGEAVYCFFEAIDNALATVTAASEIQHTNNMAMINLPASGSPFNNDSRSVSPSSKPTRPRRGRPKPVNDASFR